MWSYYSKHKGICIGLDMEKAQKYLSRIYGKIMIGCSVVEVQYKDIVEKPDYFRDAKDFFHYQLSTKAKAWEHEQEVRLFILDPWPTYMSLLPGQMMIRDLLIGKRFGLFLKSEENVLSLSIWESI